MICLDTSALFYLCQPAKPLRAGAAEQSEAVQALYREWKESKTRLILPTIAVSEFLEGLQTHEATKALSEMTSRFWCVEFDLKVAATAARIRFDVRNDHERAKIVKGLDRSKQCIKIDFLIIATALSRGANQILSGDRDVVTLAQLVGLSAIRIQDLKPSEHTRSLWDTSAKTDEGIRTTSDSLFAEDPPE